MPECGRHRDDDVDLADLEPRPHDGLHPVDKIVAKPEVVAELERVQRLARIAVELERARRAVEGRPDRLAVRAEELAVQLLRRTPASTAAAVRRRERQTIETIRTEMTPGSVDRASAGLAHSGPNEI